MAIIITSQPTYTFEPVYNYLNFKVQSSNSAQAKFQYVADVYINSVLIDSINNSPAPDGYGYFNVARIVENYVSANYSSLLTFASNPGQALLGNYIEGLVVKFGERYGSDIPVTYPDLATSNTYYPFGGALTYLDRSAYSQTTYVMDSNSTRKFLTNMPRIIYLTKSQRQFLTYMRETLLDANENFKVTAYDINDNNIFNWTVDVNINTLNNGGRFVRIPIGLPNLSEVNPTYVSGDDWSDLLAPEVEYYTISLCSTSPVAQASEIITIRFKNDICKYTPKEIIFLNRFGAFESFVFQLANTERIKINRSSYTNANPVSQLNYSKTDRRNTVSGVDMQQTFTVLSNWISEEESIWLKELLTSPTVFINESGTLIPITILTDTYDVFNKENRKLFNLKIDYEYTIKNDIQRG